MREWGVCGLRGFFRLTMAMAAIVLLLSGFAGAAFAQIATGTITGTVTDPKGAAMAGVSITVLNTETGLESPAAKSNDSGIYNISALPPGNYQVTANQTGFATVQNKGVRVQVGETLRLDIEMPVASQQSLVTVTTEAPLVETEKTEQSQTVSENMVSDLPVSSRRWEQFVLLTPGVVTDGANNNVAFHGVNSMYNNNSVDGANNNNAYNSTARGNANSGSSGDDGYTYSSDAIREFQVASSNYNAELGQAAGGQINAVTKSGTNAIHGDLFENFRYPSLNAIDPVTKANAVSNGLTPTQTVHQQNQFGGSVGGPLWKDKLFYFVNYDGYRKVTPIAFTTAAGTGGTLPISSLTCDTQITAAQCAAAKNWVLNQNLGTFPREIKQDIGFGKIDYQINQANHFSSAFNWRNWNEPSNTSFASAQNSGLAASSNYFIQDRFVIATWSTLIGNNKVNEVRYQFGEDNTFQLWNAPPPNVTLSSLFAYGQNNANPQIIYETRSQISDNFSFTKGRHSFKTGVDINVVRENAHISINSSGVYSYSSAIGLPAGTCTAPTGSSNSTISENTIFCDWLVDLYGIATSTSAGRHWTTYAQMKDQRFPGNQLNAAGAGSDNFLDQDYAGYFQDTWKARPNLTVNAGIRYDVQLYPPAPNPNPNSPLLTYYTSTVPPIDYGGIQPRLGVAWNLAKNTVIRVGFGTFFGKTTNSTISSARRTSGTREQSFNCTLSSASTLCSTLQFPNVLYAQMAQGPGPAFTDPTLGGANGNQPITPIAVGTNADGCISNVSCNIRGFDPGSLRPRAYEGDVSFERQLPGNMAFSASYLMTRGTHLPVHYDANLAPSTITKAYDIVDANGNTVLTTPALPFYTTRLDVSQGVAAPQLTGAILAEFSVVNSWYNAMALTLRKPISHGFEIQGNYTLANGTDDGEAGGVASGGIFLGGETPANPFNIRGEYGRSNIDVRNRATASVNWAPTFGKNLSSKAEKTLLDGWALSSIITISSGEPYSGTVASSAPPCSVATLIPNGQTCANVGGVSGKDGGMTAATLGSSGASAGGRLAWLPRNSFALPGYSNVDLRLAKQFIFHERYNIELRAETFNLFNSYILQAVNTTAYTYAQSGASGCPISHANTCMVPQSPFQTPVTTSGFLLGARQMQFAFRFEF